MDGVKHNILGPSATYWYENGNIRETYYFVNGIRHNTEGPAVNRWYENGLKCYEEHYENGMVTNTVGPAFTSWHRNGNVSLKVFKVNNKYEDRGDLPNQIQWNENGLIETEWYIQDDWTFIVIKHEWSDLIFYHNYGKLDNF